jgi:murein DD-endopeptidase MepM/ murein hydrolase activator NlpD
MSIIFQLCKFDGDVVNEPEIKLTDYTIKDIRWITNAICHDLEEALHTDFEYMIEIKGEIISEGTSNNTEEEAVKKLINWALAPETSKEVYKRIAIEVYSGGKVDDIKDIDPEKRIRNDSMKDAYVVTYTERYPDEEIGGKGIFSIIFRERLKDEYKTEASFPEKRYAGAEDGLKLRDTAGTDGTEIAKLPYGTEVYWDGGDKIYKDGYEWAQVKVGAAVGWVASKFLKTDDPKNNLPAPAPNIMNNITATGNYISPYGDTKATITSLYGYRRANPEFHAGFDLVVGDGIPLYSISDGVVVRVGTGISGNGGGYGWSVIIKYNDSKIGEFCAMYGHMKYKCKLEIGQGVNKGDIVGYQGATSTENGTNRNGVGNHLHFQTHKGGFAGWANNGNEFNPLKVLYNLDMTVASINSSDKFIIYTKGEFEWERTFLEKFPKVEDKFKDATIIADMNSILN